MNSQPIKRYSMRSIKPSSQAGAAAVELAFVIVVLLLIVAGTIGFGRTFWYADALTKATRDGARLMSNWPVVNLNSSGVGAAKNIAVNAANFANVKPSLDVDTNVLVECLGPSPDFSVVGCVDGTAPANVRVSITDFNVTLAEWFPFIGTSGVINLGIIGLSPHTTMRYMN